MSYYEKTRELEDFFLNAPPIVPRNRRSEEALDRLIEDLRKIESAPLVWEGDNA